MKSCWLIEFEDGHKIIISEELYKKEEKRNWAGRKRRVEAHWFDFETCSMKNPEIIVAGF